MTDSGGMMMRKKRAILTAAVFLATFSICSTFVVILAQKNMSELREKVAEIGSAHAYTLQRQLDRSLSATYALAAIIYQFGVIDNFDELAADMIERYGGISSLQLAPFAVVRQIYPLKGNEAAIGHNLLNDPERRTETLAAIQSGKLTLAGPFELIQGGSAVIGRYPVFLHDKRDPSPHKFWGLTIVLISLPELIQASNVDQLVSRGYEYELSRIHPDSARRHVFARSGQDPLDAPAKIAVSVPNGEWTLSVAPRNGWIPMQLIVSGLLISVILSLVIASLVDQRIKVALDLSVSNEQLQNEIDLHRNTAKALQMALAESEQNQKRFRAVAQTAADGIVTIDSSGTILYMNRGAETMFGYDSQEIIGEPLITMIPETYRKAHADGMNRIASGSRSRIIGKTFELSGKRKDGSLVPIELSLAQWETDDEMYFTAIIRDITERKTLEKEILDIEERERRRIGHDLHDDLGQLLTGVSFKCSTLEYDLKDKMTSEAEDAAKISSLVEDAKNKVKLLSKWITPVDPDERGLASALEDLASTTRKIFNVYCSFRGGEEILIPNAHTTTNLYRIAQEAVNNAVRHSGAAKIEVFLGKRDNSVIMTIEDDGEGLRSSQGSSGGMGIRIMNFRAGIIGGSLDIREVPGGGTCVTCICPV